MREKLGFPNLFTDNVKFIHFVPQKLGLQSTSHCLPQSLDTGFQNIWIHILLRKERFLLEMSIELHKYVKPGVSLLKPFLSCAINPGFGFTLFRFDFSNPSAFSTDILYFAMRKAVTRVAERDLP